jgi:hypothetical protein
MQPAWWINLIQPVRAESEGKTRTNWTDICMRMGYGITQRLLNQARLLTWANLDQRSDL